MSFANGIRCGSEMGSARSSDRIAQLLIVRLSIAKLPAQRIVNCLCEASLIARYFQVYSAVELRSTIAVISLAASTRG